MLVVGSPATPLGNVSRICAQARNNQDVAERFGFPFICKCMTDQ